MVAVLDDARVQVHLVLVAQVLGHGRQMHQHARRLVRLIVDHRQRQPYPDDFPAFLAAPRFDQGAALVQEKLGAKRAGTFDVHINRAPITGTIRNVVYIPGKFLNADLDKASEDNERQHFLVVADDGTKVGFTQIAGLVARRIVPWVRAGERVATGQRVGLIRFGSRVDVYLPPDTAPQLLLGQRTIAGETIVARIGLAEAPAGISQ